ncbi:similar to Saccharomyces cerevisiae YBR239C ERT1 Transcriptional regulator of nonfermentable carbon utilization [Maudiozyma barnettii]|mgnify:CR=1 FL=1|uniref:Similar to Saccharomyces cerevisiae YBR239C ERT1 Transcriptional regulator of nonfermentable carbon utilization n=1 Tax=Maudiozyma barnettii TaxID=61262 RepID=A0A8H2ZJ74_9SACH|nr:Ert1p [Kazachstania barnettii]CAB4256688.1 similar to Saccharomyces cerevisiae YBR239C ERT1 Transcriptional regulator of nonfermentable carbon utilization [Kazachstania barnettii]CAD1785344.1 similar to Saccharomyces cerevisiae YBR239C ERT1 Transcriptional regulator of nonfermentable carbon utilization [Kazachstania barnettii]
MSESIPNDKLIAKNNNNGRRRRHTSIACVNCSKWHVSCDSSRPCKRCSQKGLAASCVDAPRKKSKYLVGIPNNALPELFRDDRSQSLNGISTSMSFLSDAANSEYSMLETITQPGVQSASQPNFQSLLSNQQHGGMIHGNRPSMTMVMGMSQGSASAPGSTTALPLLSDGINNLRPIPTRATTISETALKSHDSSSTASPEHSVGVDHLISSNSSSAVQITPSQGRNAYTMILGPKSQDIVSSQIDLMKNYFPLIPVKLQNGSSSLDFKRLVPEDPAVKGTDMQRNVKINQYYLNNKTVTFPEVQRSFEPLVKGHDASFALECISPEVVQIFANPEWSHSLRYATPMEIYTQINMPFSHTSGFHHLLVYLKGRFNQDDVVEMCRSLAEFRPIFIACSVTLTEEDMIFMEQVYQRTLLEYAKFIELSGTPTCVWRRNGQISYVNEEFEILTGWKREELLNKLTFVVEILDDESVRDYFKTFSSIAYKDFKGCEQMKVCRILTPIEGQVVHCSCLWTLKRDISGLPLMILGNFMPILSEQ